MLFRSLLVLIFAGILPALESTASGTKAAAIASYIAFLGPTKSFILAGYKGFHPQAMEFWSAVLLCQAVAWSFLALASWRLPTHLESTEVGGLALGWLGRLAASLSGGNRQKDWRCLDENPVLWLLTDSGRMRGIVWALAMAGSVGVKIGRAHV